MEIEISINLLRELCLSFVDDYSKSSASRQDQHGFPVVVISRDFSCAHLSKSAFLYDDMVSMSKPNFCGNIKSSVRERKCFDRTLYVYLPQMMLYCWRQPHTERFSAYSLLLLLSGDVGWVLQQVFRLRLQLVRGWVKRFPWLIERQILPIRTSIDWLCGLKGRCALNRNLR